ncbi:helix-turn-helix domain-containing protein [Yinghuangia soli]|uniref:Helix-turn-helix domain-containing protein n=1 Tax=Yinghuangia soli TaxID=2908204 RepID=A0AA41Q0Q3_9ACTN|nr:helix-turn-helix transcriptional regulator [Yinghuangia soli]MCF2529353.1 helix-turn-helix domain-containing protein [Yinghuangia soli]
MAIDSLHALKRKRLGQELRRLREDRGISRIAAAEAIRGDVSKICRMELARAYVTPHDLATLCRLYEVPAQVQSELEQLVVGKRPRHWWREYADVMNAHLEEFVAFEDSATVEREYQPMVIGGLLQCADYIAAIMDAGINPLAAEQVESLVAVRLARQRRLRAEPVLRYHGIVSEAALHFDTGGRGVMRTQMRHLAELARLPNVVFQVVPFEAGARAAHATGFALLGFTDPADGEVAFVEGIAGMIPRDSQREVQRYHRLFGRIEQAALSPGDSLALILERAESV